METLRTIKQLLVAAVIESSDGKILMGQKPPHPQAVYPDAWHIPGGGIDDGETEKQAILREVAEETGIHTSDVTLIDDKGTGEAVRTLKSGESVLCIMEFHVYSVQLASDAAEIPLNGGDDLTNLKWFTKAELATVNLTPPSMALFKRLGYM